MAEIEKEVKKEETAAQLVESHWRTVPEILPVSTKQGRAWSETVKATRKHPRYTGYYDTSCYKKQDAAIGMSVKDTWVKTKPFDAATHSKNPQVICVDDEYTPRQPV